MKRCHGNDFRIAGIPVPKRLQRTSRVCASHLKVCDAYKRHVRNAASANPPTVKTLLLWRGPGGSASSPASAISGLTHATTVTAPPAASSAVAAAGRGATASSNNSSTTTTTKTSRGGRKRKSLVDSSLLEYFVKCSIWRRSSSR